VVRVIEEGEGSEFGEDEASLALNILRILIKWVGKTHPIWREILGHAVPMVERWIANEARHNPDHPMLREIMGLIDEYRHRKGWRR